MFEAFLLLVTSGTAVAIIWCYHWLQEASIERYVGFFPKDPEWINEILGDWRLFGKKEVINNINHALRELERNRIVDFGHEAREIKRQMAVRVLLAYFFRRKHWLDDADEHTINAIDKALTESDNGLEEGMALWQNKDKMVH